MANRVSSSGIYDLLAQNLVRLQFFSTTGTGKDLYLLFKTIEMQVQSVWQYEGDHAKHIAEMMVAPLHHLQVLDEWDVGDENLKLAINCVRAVLRSRNFLRRPD